MMAFNWTLKTVLISTMALSASLSQASFCEGVHQSQALELRPIDVFARLSETRKNDLFTKIQLPTETLNNIIIQLNAQGIKADANKQLAKIFQSAQEHLAKDPIYKDRTPYQKAEMFRAAVKNVLDLNSLDLKGDEKALLQTQIDALIYQLKYPLSTADHREVKFRPAVIESVLQKYPKLQDLLNSVDAKMDVISLSPKVDDARNIPFFAGHKVNPKQKLDATDPVITNTLRDIYNEMQDKDAFKNYVKDLIKESAVVMDQRQDAKEIALLQDGKVSREAALKVVIARFKSRGVEFGVIKKNGTNTNDYFREMVNKSAMFDLAFGPGSGHGQEVHLVQVDYIYDTVYKSTQGDIRKFWNYLGSKKGIWFWYDLFDSSQQDLTRPEFFGPMIRNWISFR